MATDNQINLYGINASKTTTTATKSASSLGSQDFLQLLAAQMSNQDVMNPTDNTEYVSQLAQFTSLQAMTTLSDTATSQLNAIQSLSQITYVQYGASLSGKNVVVATTDDAGAYKEDTGIVSNVNFTSGVCTLTVNGKKYPISAVMDITTPTTTTGTTDPTGTAAATEV